MYVHSQEHTCESRFCALDLTAQCSQAFFFFFLLSYLLLDTPVIPSFSVEIAPFKAYQQPGCLSHQYTFLHITGD